MLKTVNILERLDLIDREKYKDMLSQVNIPDFYKVCSQFSGIEISKIDDEAMAATLITWCKNKYRFYEMLGKTLRKDLKIEYKKDKKDRKDEFREIEKQFPIFGLWLEMFEDQNQNKIETCNLSYRVDEAVRKYFPNFKLNGTLLTRFFKNELKAPDTLVTAIGRIFENDTVNANYTISINPVDMMLASENPYNWESCYRLETPNESSHADGCMAAVLDTTSLISYIWEREGEFNLYNEYKFKKIRYYRMRQWVSIIDDFSAIHFNAIYPGKSYEEDFEKLLRDKVETIVAEFKGVKNLWRKNSRVVKEQPDKEYYTYGNDVAEIRVERKYYYGYGEVRDEYVYINNELRPALEGVQPDYESKYFLVYDTPIFCLCGCGTTLIGSDECVEEGDDGTAYNGEGFCCENFFESEYECEYKWCDYLDGYCDRGCYEDEECDDNCPYYNKMYPLCDVADGRCWDNYDMNEEERPVVNEGVACPHSKCATCQRCWSFTHLSDEERAKIDEQNNKYYNEEGEVSIANE